MINKISIIGGDLRIVKLAEMLIREGVEVFSYGLERAEVEDMVKCKTLNEAIEKSNVILGSIPFSYTNGVLNLPFSDQKIEVNEVIESIKDKIFIVGNLKTEILEICNNNNTKVIDILKREDMAILNAISTAEGTIKIMIEETQKNIHGSNVLIMGFGRIGKILSNMLEGLGAQIVCEARKPADLAWAKAYGYEPLPLSKLEENLDRFDIIINTIPSIILDEKMLASVRKDALIVDLASAPGGVDKNAVKKQNIKFIWALALPGKVAPITSAEFIKEILYNIFSEIN